MATAEQDTRRTLTVIGTEPITAEQMMETDERGELVEGVFCPTMAPGFEHGKLMTEIASLLRDVVRPEKLGHITSGDSFVLLSGELDTLLGPDVAYFSKERIPLDTVNRGASDVPPEIVVEIGSPSQNVNDVRGKAALWVLGGVTLVWVVWPDSKTVEVYRRDRPAVRLTEDDTLSGEDVLPQFSVPVRDIFDV